MDLLLAIGPGATSGEGLALIKGLVIAVLALAGLGVVGAALFALQAVTLVGWAVVRGALGERTRRKRT